ncbi:MAG: NAD(P)H-binding protein, partial [Coriobacteriia bacterium]|nr:NAD(P)H-binding protein [Coriobacteriia bacterium]
DAVISVLAPRPSATTLFSEGTRNLADAAAAEGVIRFVAASAEGAGIDPDRLPLAYRAVLLYPHVAEMYRDIAVMERELVERTDLKWTVVRAAVLKDGPPRGAYRVSEGDLVPDGLTVSRADLAAFLLDVTERDRFVRKRLAIAD